MCVPLIDEQKPFKQHLSFDKCNPLPAKMIREDTVTSGNTAILPKLITFVIAISEWLLFSLGTSTETKHEGDDCIVIGAGSSGLWARLIELEGRSFGLRVTDNICALLIVSVRY